MSNSDFNVQRSALGVQRSDAASVDAENPWLGLVSFTEETRGFFHGREEEAAELGRRVQRKLLTILFGQSGLGKTSILQAGLVPRIRPEGFCPVYVRLDYSAEAVSPSEQIKQTVIRTTAAAGKWSKSGIAQPGESLWEFFHHRDDILTDAAGKVLTPVLIFDQFEEIFTLAQSDDAGRRRAQEFVADLANLIENRPPVALEARIDSDEIDAAEFDFARADYRILISLREDYLANLEGLKAQMPSVTQNRMRLARMTGAQAIAAVREPAPGLVSEAVAGAIVRFVAGGADLDRAEVEPSLLSLICRELNNTRLAQGHPEISADLLAGSRDSILQEFYERAVADQPAGVREFIEDVLLTDSGFRENVAEERVRKAFAEAGAPEAVMQLVDRRLLRIEERLDIRRVELTHDVLCGVVKTSRDLRREREALAASERRAAEIEAREAATRRSMWRARIAGAGAGILFIFAAASAVFGYRNMEKAQVAQTAAQEQELFARKLAYAADMNVALQALRGNNLGRARDLLDRQRPSAGQRDLRGWEWRYLWKQTRSDALSILCEKTEIESIATSADGRWLAIGVVHRDGVFVWDLRTREEVAHVGQGLSNIRVAFSPTESLLAFTGWDDAVEGGNPHLHIWNASTRAMVAEYPLQENSVCAGLTFSADGRTLVTSSTHRGDGHITLRRVSDGTQVALYSSDQGYLPPATGFAANSDLSLAAYATSRGQVRVVDLHTGKELWTAEASKTFITALAFSPDGRTLASAAGFAESDIRLWDVATGKETGRLEGHTSWVGSLVFWPDGKKLASASADQTIRTWDLTNRTCTDVMRGHRLEVWRLALLPDARTLVSGSKDGAVCLWDTSVPHPRREHLTLAAKVVAWSFESDGRSIVTVDRAGQVADWSGPDFESKRVLMETGGDGLDAVSMVVGYGMRFSKDGRFLARAFPDGKISAWDLSRSVPSQPIGTAGGRWPVGFLGGGSRLVSGAETDSRIVEWDVAAGLEIQSWLPAGDWRLAGISPDERLLVAPSYDGEISVRNLREQTSTVLQERVLEGSTATFSPSGRLLVITSQLGFARVLDTETWREVVTLRGYLNSVPSAAFSPDGARLATSASAEEEALKIWAVDSWQEVLTLPAEGDLFGHTKFSPDGDAVGILSTLGQLHIWQAPSWEEIKAAEAPDAH